MNAFFIIVIQFLRIFLFSLFIFRDLVFYLVAFI